MMADFTPDEVKLLLQWYRDPSKLTPAEKAKAEVLIDGLLTPEERERKRVMMEAAKQFGQSAARTKQELGAKFFNEGFNV